MFFDVIWWQWFEMCITQMYEERERTVISHGKYIDNYQQWYHFIVVVLTAAFYVHDLTNNYFRTVKNFEVIRKEKI